MKHLVSGLTLTMILFTLQGCVTEPVRERASTDLPQQAKVDPAVSPEKT